MTDALVVEYLITGLTSGQAYLFKIRARNIYGYGSFSPTATILASDVPNVMTTINTVNIGTNILIIWSAPPGDGGETIDAYEVQLYLPLTDTFV